MAHEVSEEVLGTIEIIYLIILPLNKMLQYNTYLYTCEYCTQLIVKVATQCNIYLYTCEYCPQLIVMVATVQYIPVHL